MEDGIVKGSKMEENHALMSSYLSLSSYLLPAWMEKRYLQHREKKEEEGAVIGGEGVGAKKDDSLNCVGLFKYILTMTGSCNVGHGIVYIQGSLKTTGTASD
jgi:hypothetical protein